MRRTLPPLPGSPCGGASPAISLGLRRVPPTLSALACLAGLLGACASAGPSRGVATGFPTEASRPAPDLSAAAPWEIPAEELGTQRLFRGRFEEADGGGGRFRMTLRLLAADRFQLTMVDPLGRSLWTLHVEDARGVWIDHRSESFCRFAEQVTLSELWLGAFPVADLPALILGRLPAAPAAGVPSTDIRGGDGRRRLELEDAAGRRWMAQVDGGRVARWALRDGSEAVLEWTDETPWRVLRDHRRGFEVRWLETVSEASTAPLDPPEMPRGYAESLCARPRAGP